VNVIQSCSREKIIQNLEDCGCSEKIIEAFMKKLDAGQKKEALRILSGHRRQLLDQFHKCNDNIFCLDYLVEQVENNKV